MRASPQRKLGKTRKPGQEKECLKTGFLVIDKTPGV
jgi:hypothetical protein